MAEFLKKENAPCRIAKRIKPPHGFTLLEVMVALAILAITLTSIYRLHSQTMLMSARSRFYSQAPLLAQSKLAEIDREGIKNSEDGSGDFGQAYPNYAWSVRIEDVSSDLLKDNKQHLTRIEVTVTQNEQETYQIRTYRYFSE
jgi:general secretion pathway protein I